jgi:hypothetical protein
MTDDDQPVRPLRLEDCFGRVDGTRSASIVDSPSASIVIEYLLRKRNRPVVPPLRRRVQSGLRFAMTHGERRLLDRRVSPRDRGTIKLVVG